MQTIPVIRLPPAHQIRHKTYPKQNHTVLLFQHPSCYPPKTVACYTIPPFRKTFSWITPGNLSDIFYIHAITSEASTHFLWHWSVFPPFKFLVEHRSIRNGKTFPLCKVNTPAASWRGIKLATQQSATYLWYVGYWPLRQSPYNRKQAFYCHECACKLARGNKLRERSYW